MKKFINENDNILEIGANIGSHCIPMSKFNQKGKYFCFEPQIDIFKILVSNIMINNCHNVIPYNYGLSVKEEIIYYERKSCYDTNRGAFTIPSNESNTGENKLFLKTQTLQYFKEIDSIKSLKLIKMDIELMEPIVIRNITPLIEKFRPIIFMEYHGLTFKNLKNYVKNEITNYSIYYFNTSNNEYARILGQSDFRLLNGDTNLVCFPKEYTDIPSYLVEVGDEDRARVDIKCTIDQVISNV